MIYDDEMCSTVMSASFILAMIWQIVLIVLRASGVIKCCLFLVLIPLEIITFVFLAAVVVWLFIK